MILEAIRRIFTLEYEYDNIIVQYRAQRMLYIFGVIIFVSFIWSILVSLPGFLNAKFNVEQIAPPIILLVVVGLYYMVQRGQIVWASLAFITLLFAFTVLPHVNNVNTPELLFGILPIVLAGAILDRRLPIIVTALIAGIILRGALFGDIETPLAVSLSFVVLLSGVLLSIFNSNLDQITESSSRLIMQARNLQKYDSDGEVDETQLISNAIHGLRSNLGFNYVRVVLLDEIMQPLRTLYSSIGVEQVAENTTFSFSKDSAFQQVIDTSAPMIVTSQDATHLSDHLLPSSSVGVLIPARSFNQTVAIVDIQTDSHQSIEQETISILNLFVRQIASDLIYQRTVNTLNTNISEQQNIIDQQQQQLLGVQHRQTEGINSDWRNYLQQRGLNAIGYDIDNRQQLSDLTAGDVPDELRSAFEKGEVVVQAYDTGQRVSIPIRFRETILGAMSFTIPKGIPMTDRRLEFIRSVTDRLALALDNKRLLEQTQAIAEREGIANEIGSVLLSSTDVETVLQTAAERFNEALGAVTTQIYLQPEALKSIESQQLEDTV